MTDTKLVPLKPISVAKVQPASVAKVPEAPKSKYLVVKLGEHVDMSQKSFADAAVAGYTKLESVYVITAPSGAGTAFAILSA